MRATTEVEINELFANRRSPRSFDSEFELSRDDSFALLEAARWAPSSNNIQPWRFIFGLRGSSTYDEILLALVPFNQSWAFRASALIAVGGEPETDEGKPNATYLFDCGLSVAQLTLEAHHRGLAAHQMAGFDAEKATKLFSGQRPIVIVAIGKQAPAERLEGAAFEREQAPRSRKELSEIVLSGLPL